MIESIDRKTIGNDVKLARKESKLSQFELAELVGIDEKQIYRIEAGLSSPKLEVFLKIVKILDLKINFVTPIELSNKPYIKEISNIFAKASEKEMKIYFNVIKSIHENL